MNIQQSYDVWAASYDADRNLTRDLDKDVLRELLDGASVDAALELGCGTGKNTGFLAGIARHLRALDFSAEMLSRARMGIEADNVSFGFADLTGTWPCEDASIDLVVCNLVLEHIQDLDHIFREASRVLRMDGTLLISELHPFRQYQGSQANFTRTGVTFEIPAFTHHVSDFLGAAVRSGLRLDNLREWWHPSDHGRPPRLITFVFRTISRASNGAGSSSTTGP